MDNTADLFVKANMFDLYLKDKSDPKGSELEEQVNNVKIKLDELTGENRRLRSELTDAHTNLALVRSELATVRQQHKEKCQEVSM